MGAYLQTKRWWMRVASWLIIIAFVSQDIVRAQGSIPVAWSTKRDSTPANTLAIPSDLGSTKVVFREGDSTVINIQDAHASVDAQRSIVSILDSLVTNYDVSVVAVEGTSGYIDTSLLRTLPDAALRRDAASELMAQGRMSAGEFFTITSGKNVALYGVEDDGLYRKNLEEFRSLYETSGSVRAEIDSVRSALEALKQRIYSPALRDLETNTRLHREGKITFATRWQRASKFAARAGLDYEPYANLARFAESVDLEKRVNFERAERQRGALLDTLSKKLPKSDLEEIVIKSVAFKSGTMSRTDYHLFLQALARKASLDPASLRDLIAYTDYLVLYGSIDLAALFGEMERFERAIANKLSASDDERSLLGLSKCLELIAGVFELKLTRENYGRLVRELETCNAASFNSFIRQASSKYGVTAGTGDAVEALFSRIPEALAFYRTAEERNEALVANTIGRMRREGKNAAALITGGYHSGGMAEVLKGRNASYLVILPKFDATKGERPYAAILTKKRAPYDALLKSGDYYLATSAYFAADGTAEEDRFAAYTDDFRKIFDRATADITDEAAKQARREALADEWSARYRAFYEDFVREQDRRRSSGLEAADFTPRPPDTVEMFLHSLITPSAAQPSQAQPAAAGMAASANSATTVKSGDPALPTPSRSAAEVPPENTRNASQFGFAVTAAFMASAAVVLAVLASLPQTPLWASAALYLPIGIAISHLYIDILAIFATAGQIGWTSDAIMKTVTGGNNMKHRWIHAGLDEDELPFLTRMLLELHEDSHDAGYGDIVAYLLPGYGAYRKNRRERDEFIDGIVDAIQHSSSVSTEDLIHGGDANRFTMLALANRLKKITSETSDLGVRARAMSMAGHIYSRYQFFGSGAFIERRWTKRTMAAIRDAVRRTVPVPSDKLKIPEKYLDSGITIHCPVRADFSHGGASDLFVFTFDLKDGGRAINFALDLDGRSPITVRVKRIGEPVVRIRSIDLGIDASVETMREMLDYSDREDPLRLIKAAFIVTGIILPYDPRPLAEILQALGGGIEIETESLVPKGSGLGTSSILGAGILEALYRISGQEKKKDELVDGVLYLEQMLGIGGGWQDPVGGIYGGIKDISSPRGKPAPLATQVRVPEGFIPKLEDRMVFYFTGKSHFAGDILNKLIVEYLTRSRVQYESRKRLVKMDDRIREAVERGDISALGRLLGEFWMEWRILNPEASNDEIDRLFDAVDDLIEGGKLCGAGGGGFALFIAKEGKKAQLEARLKALKLNKHARLYRGSINTEGLTMTVTPASLRVPDRAQQALSSAKDGIVIGLPAGTPDYVITAVRMAMASPQELLGVKFEIVVFDNGIDGFNARIASGDRGIYIDRTFIDEAGTSVIVDIQQAVRQETSLIMVGSKTSAELERAIHRVNSSLPRPEPLSVEELQNALNSMMDRTRPLYKKSGVASAVDAAVAKNGPTAIALTEGIVENDLFSAEDMESVSANEKITPYFIYGSPAEGREEISGPEAARKYLSKRGYSEKALESIKFIQRSDSTTYADLVAEIARTTDCDPSHIGVAALTGEFERRPEDAGVLLEVCPVTVYGKGVYVTANTVQTLLGILARYDGAALDSVGIPGLSYDQARKVFSYLPRAIPWDYQRELELFKNAQSLLRSAA